MYNTDLQDALEGFVRESGRAPRSMRELANWQGRKEFERLMNVIDSIQVQLKRMGLHLNEHGVIVRSN